MRPVAQSAGCSQYFVSTKMTTSPLPVHTDCACRKMVTARLSLICGTSTSRTAPGQYYSTGAPFDLLLTLARIQGSPHNKLSPFSIQLWNCRSIAGIQLSAFASDPAHETILLILRQSSAVVLQVFTLPVSTSTV